jgi:NADH:ubiquinone oxidoreductase subunit 3 (subunit A)
VVVVIAPLVVVVVAAVVVVVPLVVVVVAAAAAEQATQKQRRQQYRAGLELVGVTHVPQELRVKRINYISMHIQHAVTELNKLKLNALVWDELHSICFNDQKIAETGMECIWLTPFFRVYVTSYIIHKQNTFQSI